MCGTNATSNKKPASRLLSSTVAGVAVAFAGLAAGPAIAQDDSPSESVLEEILVTAQKRVQTLQDVPSSVSAILLLIFSRMFLAPLTWQAVPRQTLMWYFPIGVSENAL